VLVGFLAASTAAARQAPETRPEDVLKGFDLKRSGSIWILSKEAAFLKDYKDAQALSQEVSQGVEQQQAMELGGQERKAYVEQLRQQQILLNQQIEQISQQLSQLVMPPGGNNFVAIQRNQLADQNNRLVAAANQVASQLKNLEGEGAEQAKDQKLQLNAEVAQKRESYIQAIMDLRKAADEIQAKYKGLAANQEVAKALEALNASTKNKQKLGPSPQFLAAVKRLGRSEGSVASDTVEVQQEGGVHVVNVMLNGKVLKPMVYDTGASVVTISTALATQIGLKPRPDDPTRDLTTADNTVVKAKIITVPSVRIGKITLTNVECAVMPPEKGDVTPLLGRSFLGRLDEHKITKGGKALYMSMLDLSKPAAKPTATAKARRPPGQPKTKASSKRATRRQRPSSTRDQSAAEDGSDPPN
jgi:clan AA aspartic protease (TIGR02281 family)